jgi:hypothetical protein
MAGVDVGSGGSRRFFREATRLFRIFDGMGFRKMTGPGYDLLVSELTIVRRGRTTEVQRNGEVRDPMWSFGLMLTVRTFDNTATDSWLDLFAEWL